MLRFRLVVLALGISMDVAGSSWLADALDYSLWILGVFAFIALVLGLQWDREQRRRRQEEKQPMPILTPIQKALIQFVESLIITALIAGLFAVSTTLGQDGPVDWKQVGIAFALAAIYSIAHGIAAYFKKSSQPDLGTAMEQIMAELEKRYPILTDSLVKSAIPQRASLVPPGASYKPTAQVWPPQQGPAGPGGSTGG